MEGDEDVQAQFRSQIQNGRRKVLTHYRAQHYKDHHLVPQLYTLTPLQCAEYQRAIQTTTMKKLIMGRRHYYNYQLTAITCACWGFVADKDKIDDCITTYNLKYPTVEETMTCIKLSTDMYWYDGSVS